MPRYSKGSRGLSVLPQEHGICTATPISLSLQSRQWGIRYAIRAGRNLPDKEFRYLRTVIVTAAVYRGLNSKLLGYPMTSPHDLPAPGRRQTLYIHLQCLQSPVFLLNSRYPLASAPEFSYGPRGSFTYNRATFFRSYSSNLQSSLTGVLSRALGYSPRPPVSVSGTSRLCAHYLAFLVCREHMTSEEVTPLGLLSRR